MQQALFNRIRDQAVFSNRHFDHQGSPPAAHLLYTLKGIERIWPHRVNSIKRLQYLMDEFSGFECDILFDSASGGLYIAHDPAERTALAFSDYLAQPGAHTKLFWLDVKNLDPHNVDAFCAQLSLLDRRYSIKNRIIVESFDTGAIRRLEADGWFSSFYLPYDYPAKTTNQTNRTEAIVWYLEKSEACISEDIRLHDFMTQHFPWKKQLVWDINFWHGMDPDRLLKAANDSSILLCLVNVKSPGYR